MIYHEIEVDNCKIKYVDGILGIPGLKNECTELGIEDNRILYS